MAGGRIVYDAVPVNDSIPEDDVEAAFNDWRDDLGGSETPGLIRAYRVPLDDQGQASHSAKNQIRLGAWPIDAFNFDELCEKIKVEYMLPNERTMAVRFLGSCKGKGGVGFNRLIVLQRANSVTEAVSTAAGTGSVAEILQAMQSSQAATLRTIQEMSSIRQDPAQNMQGMMQFAAMFKMMMEPMVTLMAGRAPGVASDPIAGMKGMLEAMTMLDDLRGGGGGRGGGSETAEIIKAVAGVGTPLLQLAVQANANKPAIAAPIRKPQPTPAPVRAPVHAPVQAAGNTPPMTPSPSSVGVDLSRPSPLPPGSLSPGPNISTPSQAIPVTPSHQAETTVNFAETKARIDAFVSIAESGADPVEVANTFFDQEMMALDDEGYSQLAANIDDPAFISQIAIFNPGVNTYRGFFEKLQEQLSRLISQETDEATREESEG